MELKILTGILGSIFGIIFGYLAFKRNYTNDLKADAKEATQQKVEVNTKLDILLSNNSELKVGFKELDKKLDTFKDDVNVRLTRLEETGKHFNERLEIVEKRGGRK